MALLSAIDNGKEVGTSVTSSISGETLIIIFLIIGCILLFVGLVWLILKSVELTDEKKEYYKNLNKKLLEKDST